MVWTNSTPSSLDDGRRRRIGSQPMKFSFFHLMPWTHVEEVGADWPISNRLFDPEVASGVYATYLDQMAYAEECGFDWIGCNEHHYSPYGMMTNPNIIGGALTQRTRTAKLAMIGNLVPMLNPVRVAEEYAMLDVMSGGRLVAGLIRGIPHEYAAYNMPADESWPRFREAVELIVKAWTEPEPFGWDGEFFHFRQVSIWPRPRQQPHPPLLFSASAPDSARFAAQHHASMGITNFANRQVVIDVVRSYKEAAHEFGWEPTPENILVSDNVCIADTDAEAERWMAQGAAYLFGPLSGGPRTAQKLVLQRTRYYEDAAVAKANLERRGTLKAATVQDRIETGGVLCGSPESVVQQLRRNFEDFGHGVQQMTFKVGNIPDEVVTHGMKLFKERVLPEVRDLGIDVKVEVNA